MSALTPNELRELVAIAQAELTEARVSMAAPTKVADLRRQRDAMHEALRVAIFSGTEPCYP
jgi:glycerol dehydrogenase-like iron-containing ADH family enzyme